MFHSTLVLPCVLCERHINQNLALLGIVKQKVPKYTFPVSPGHLGIRVLAVVLLLPPMLQSRPAY